jgi:diguanylate cyclase
MKIGSALMSAMSSLKARLALASFALIALSVAVTILFVLRDVGNRTQRAALDAELANSERFAEILSSRLISLQTSMRSAASGLPLDDVANPDALIGYLDHSVVLRSSFDNVFIAAPDGQLLAAADDKGIRRSTISVSDRPYFRKTLEEGRPVVSEPIVSRASKEAMVVLTMPVQGRNGEIVAVMGCGVRLTTNALVGGLTRSGGDGSDPFTAIVTDATGRIISHPDETWILKDAQTEPRFADAVAAWMSQGRPVDPQGSSRRFGDAIVSYAGIPNADWMVFRSARAEVLLGGPTAGLLKAMWIGVGVAVAGGAVILLTTTLMLRPLRQLERRAIRLLGNDIAAEDGWPDARGELGRLARVFQHVMRERAAIQKSGDELLLKMQAVMGNAPVGIAFTRLSHFELVSSQFGIMFGHSCESVVGKPTHMICVSEDEHRALGLRVASAFAAGRMFDEEIELVKQDGSRFWVRRQGAPVRAGDIGAGTIWTFTDITETKVQREQLSWTASHDALTGLVNRREFEIRLSEQLSDRRESEAAAALFIDLDRFKAVNDTGGHAAGDEMLKNVATILASRARSDDTVARLGGDEFAMLLRRCDKASAERVATQICERVHAFRLQWQGMSLGVGASIGVVEIEPALKDSQAVLAAADAACYEAKRAGKNAVRTHPRVQPAVVSETPA